MEHLQPLGCWFSRAAAVVIVIGHIRYRQATITSWEQTINLITWNKTKWHVMFVLWNVQIWEIKCVEVKCFWRVLGCQMGVDGCFEVCFLLNNNKKRFHWECAQVKLLYPSSSWHKGFSSTPVQFNTTYFRLAMKPSSRRQYTVARVIRRTPLLCCYRNNYLPNQQKIANEFCKTSYLLADVSVDVDGPISDLELWCEANPCHAVEASVL